ncbi:MAG TPA: gfo/Idh/MocA family oxidoreductase [Desulfobacter sp.]|uniref:Gfo/Idh/MocA family protein n=1 Tax=Desulfobacter sp. UBA2225 TaxID=1961413 RepID=UPI000E928460|nr:Gfo/Idh/MocA family oxidoreductase [Desulfobacter sp. UBA2225]HAR33726.1 gfo/Idh/MocA family oxidoreductase [Desulfobacter sp.]
MAGKMLRVALIGCGRIAVKHIMAITKKNSGLLLCAVTDRTSGAFDRLFDFCKLSGKTKDQIRNTVNTYTDYQEMLQNEKPDITSITAPSGLHYSMAKAAMLSGSHILLEKPMSMKTSQAKELFDLSEQKNRRIAMGHIFRYFPVVRNLQKDVAAGRFGKISHGSVIVRWGHDQAYYDQTAWRGTWKNDGGVLMNQCIHAIDLICWLMNGQATAANAMLGKRFHDMEAEDIALGILKLDNGALCQIEGTTNAPSRDHEASFYLLGEKGAFRMGIRRGKPYFDIRINGKKKNFEYVIKEIRSRGVSGLRSLTNPHVAIYADLRDAVLNQKSPIADARSGMTSVESVLALYLSAKEKRQIEIPLATDFSSQEMSEYIFGE